MSDSSQHSEDATGRDESTVGLLFDSAHIQQRSEKSRDDDFEDPSFCSSCLHEFLPEDLVKRIAPYVLTLIVYFTRFLAFLLPSFISNALSEHQSQNHSRPQTPTRIVRPTAYLDGLRGLAAWAVVNDHLCHILSRTAGIGFGWGGQHYDLYKLPILRLLYDGTFSVSLFFIISGYALSISPVAAMNKPGPRDSAAAMKKFVSAIFRRPFRLFLPCWGATLVVFVLIRLGYFEYFEAQEPTYTKHYLGWGKIAEEWAPRLPSFVDQVRDLIWDDLRLLWIFTAWYDKAWSTRYDLPLWTIPLEFRASLVLFLTQAAVFYMRRKARIAITCFLILVAIYLQAFDFPLFWLGYLMAECSPLIHPPKNTLRDLHRTSRHPPWLIPACWVLLGLMGLYLASFPSWGAPDTPGYAWMATLSPWPLDNTDRFYTGIGAGLLILVLEHLAWARAFLSCAFIEYLGKLSFSFYLMHFGIVQTIGAGAFHYAWELTGQQNLAATFVGFAMAYTVMMCVIVWVSDVFMRCVDVYSVSLGFKVQAFLFREE